MTPCMRGKYYLKSILIILVMFLKLDSNIRAQQTAADYTPESPRDYTPESRRRVSEVLPCPVQDNSLVLGAMQQEIRQLSTLLGSIKQQLRERTSDKATPSNSYCNKNVSGIYSLTPTHIGVKPIDVYCDVTSSTGDSWLVIQRRINGKVDFYRNWENYKNGFGDLDGEFWLGNDNLYRLTSYGTFRLRIELEDFKGQKRFAEYEHFRIGSETDKYKMSFTGYYGDAGDSLSYHKDMSFTTFDNDNDRGPSNCATDYTGAWWYQHCHNSNLNGRYNSSGNLGPRWSEFSGQEPLKWTEMKIKEIDCT